MYTVVCKNGLDVTEDLVTKVTKNPILSTHQQDTIDRLTSVRE